MFTEVSIALIKVSNRARKDMGDINALSNSIAKHGLFHPVTLDNEHNLLAGGRRLEAVKGLGWENIPARFFNELNALERLEIELEENLQRKEMTWQEVVELRASIDKIKRELYGGKTFGQRTDLGEGGAWGLEDTAAALSIAKGSLSQDLQLARAMTVLPELKNEETKIMAFRKMKRLESLIIRELLARQTMRLPSDQLPFEVKVGNVYEKLKELEDDSVQCVVTSPPYWNQRDYGVAGQLGLEASPDEYVQNLANVFDELLHRVLRKDGVVWVNIDDTYADENKGGAPTGFVYDTQYGNSVRMVPTKLELPAGMKKKDLVGIPWLFAFEMRRRGWWLRSCVIWYKSSSTPEGTTDRPVNIHEFIFMFSKADVYKFNNQDWLAADPMKRKLRSVWPIDLSPTGDSEHIAAFPEELPRCCILASSDPGDVVLDPFMGSGATGVSALLADRDFIGIELNPTYAENADRRLRAAHAEELVRELDDDVDTGDVQDSVVDDSKTGSAEL